MDIGQQMFQTDQPTLFGHGVKLMRTDGWAKAVMAYNKWKWKPILFANWIEQLYYEMGLT